MRVIRAALCVFTDGTRFLLQHRDSHAPVTPNTWGYFGGHFEKGETPEDCIRRELREELQIDITPRFFKQFVSDQDGELREYFVFLSTLPLPVETLRKQQREGDGIGWFTLAELRKLEDFPHHRLKFAELVATHLSKAKDFLSQTR